MGQGRERYWQQVRRLADEHNVSVPEARTMWSQFFKKSGVRKLVVELSARVSNGSTAVCPFCREELPVFHDHEDACYQCGSFNHPEPGDYDCGPEPVWSCSSCSMISVIASIVDTGNTGTTANVIV